MLWLCRVLVGHALTVGGLVAVWLMGKEWLGVGLCDRLDRRAVFLCGYCGCGLPVSGVGRFLSKLVRSSSISVSGDVE